MKKILFLLLLIVAVPLILEGCTSYPISKKYREEVTPAVTFENVLADPDKYKGNVVIWGGDIIQTENDSTGGSLVVLQIPLDNNERPAQKRYSQGRFIARSSHFLDPEIFKNGTTITIAGQVAGSKKIPIDKLLYNYPVITIKQVFIWQKEANYQYYYYPWPGYWGYWGPYYDFGDDDNGHFGGYDNNKKGDVPDDSK